MTVDIDETKRRLLALNLTRKAGPWAAAAQLYRMYGHSGRTLFAKATRVDPTDPPQWPHLPPGINEGRITQEEARLVEIELQKMRQAEVDLVTWVDEEYPLNLRHIICPPPVLYCSGTLVPGDWLAVAVVGSRRASAEYIDFANRIGFELAQAGITVVSGLARGIDRAAHEGALAAGGRTIAVLGTGADVCYPKSHKPLAGRIAQNGALLTYYPMGTPPLSYHFPARNWVIAGLALMTVVVQCGVKSGALITAQYAASQGRDVMVVPGNVTSSLARGSNELIKDGAGVITRPQDIIDTLQRDLSFFGFSLEQTSDEGRDGSPSLSNRIVEALDLEIYAVDEMARYLGEKVDDIQSALIRLELEGKVQSMPDGSYRLRFKSVVE